jgi:hypothetical protein
METYEEWGADTFQNAELFAMAFYFDIDGHNHPPILSTEAFAGEGSSGLLVFFLRQTTRVSMRRWRPTVAGSVVTRKVWRPDSHTVQVEFPVRLLGKDIQRNDWCAFTFFHEDDLPVEQCGTSGDQSTTPRIEPLMIPRFGTGCEERRRLHNVTAAG